MRLPSYLCRFIPAFLCAVTLHAAEEGKSALPADGAAKVPAVDFQAQLPIAATHDEAISRAEKEKRLVMTVFASSACPHCKAFRTSVLSTPEFRKYASEKLVLVIIDLSFTDVMTKREQDLLDALMDSYRVKGTPHITVESPAHKVLLDSEGYRGTEAAQVVADLDKLWKQVFAS